MEGSVCDLRLHRHKYMHELNKTSTSLSGVDNDLLPLKLVGSLSDQVAHLIKNMAMKDQALTTIYGYLGYAQKRIKVLSSSKFFADLASAWLYEFYP